MALAAADVVVPALDGDLGAQVRRRRGAARASGTGWCEVDVAGLVEALEECPVGLSTMGRGLVDDPACFLASAAAGRHAAQLLTPR